MRIFAYAYTDPLLDAVPEADSWGEAVDQVYQDLGTIPTPEKEGRSDNRPLLQQLLQDCRIQPPQQVWVRRLEELGDSVAEVGDRLRDLEDLGIELVVLEQPYQSLQLSAASHRPSLESDNCSPTPPAPKAQPPNQPPDTETQNPASPDLRQSDLVHLLEEVQQNQRSRRIRQGHARNRVKALPPPGKSPYGYRRGKDRYILDRSTAPVVKEFFENFLLYGSIRGAVRRLEKKYGKKISVSTGKRWLTNPVYRGDLAYQDGQTVSDTHTPILSRDEAAQVDRLLRRNRRLPPRTASAPRSLSGLVVCAQCDSGMKVSRVAPSRKTPEYLYLRPIACPHRPKCKAIRYEKILEQTIEQICEELPQAVAKLSLPDMGGIKQGMTAQIQAKQEVLAQIPQLLETGVLDAETANLRTYNLKTEIAALQQQQAQLPPVNLKETAQAVSIPQFWLDLSETERRFYFREFIRQIQLVRDDEGWTLELCFIF